MGVLPAVFDVDAGRRPATRALAAGSLQRAALDDPRRLPLEDDAHELSALEGSLRSGAALDTSGSLRGNGARSAHDFACGIGETQRAAERNDSRQPHGA